MNSEEVTLEPGGRYLVEEMTYGRSLSIFNDLLEQGYKGMCICQKNPKQLQKEIKDEVTYIWITGRVEGFEDTGFYKAISPSNLNKLLTEIEDFVKTKEEIGGKAVVYIEGFTRIDSHNEFNSVYGFTKMLADFIAKKNSLLIISFHRELTVKKHFRLLRNKLKLI